MENTFYKANGRIINLKNVSNINLIPSSLRIVFNFNYSIKMGNKFISDYNYLDCADADEFLHCLEILSTHEYLEDNFISQLGNSGFININSISSIKFSEKKNRVIFNLNHPVTFTNFEGRESITSEFVYVNCPDWQTYKEYVNYVKTNI